MLSTRTEQGRTVLHNQVTNMALIWIRFLSETVIPEHVIQMWRLILSQSGTCAFNLKSEAGRMRSRDGHQEFWWKRLWGKLHTSEGEENLMRTVGCSASKPDNAGFNENILSRGLWVWFDTGNVQVAAEDQSGGEGQSSTSRPLSWMLWFYLATIQGGRGEAEARGGWWRGTTKPF